MIVQELLAQYRVPFYERLREQLNRADVQLDLVHGRASGQRAMRGDEAHLDWATTVRSIQLPVGRRRAAVWQPALKQALASDLTIVEHANRQLLNYPLLLTSKVARKPHVAFWGHGANLQSSRPDSFEERFKAASARWPDWWFAYTEGSAERVRRAGFPSDRVTVVQNAIDTSDYAVNGIERSPRRCVYVGSLHEHKRLDFLLETAALVAERVDGFELLVVGDGPDRARVEQTARQARWLTYRGALFGKAKAEAVSSSSLTLMPGLVGLGVLDSFASGSPMVTTRIPWHSPEFEYLEDGRNGLVLPGEASAADFAMAVADLLLDPSRLSALREGAIASSRMFSVDEMADRFTGGILNALGSARG
ncbi:glycosyltransferase family 4 protein [Nocardioides iriomotensis]|uniref:glycosyltransferase family 4 protein n=1 Tax=Nocardioides iriomotensis TaxID=715784 RepID=UPI0013E9EE10|nr:glycosyltransferase family 4 protein [Nocardioides iriomotensis]